MIQLCGCLNLLIGQLLGRWTPSLATLLMEYALGPLPAQLLLCITVGLLSVVLRRLLQVEP